ncbi:MAG: AMP-binding protein, partial [Oricola sp.]|nr:AMP-binding protein [Oricola sp.]
MGDQVKRIERRSRRAIFQAYLENARKEKADKVAVTDGDGRKLTLKEITRAAFALGGALARHTAKAEHVGILLPTGAGAIIALFALLSRGRIPAMLNFTSGSKNLLAACRAAEVKKIVTAKKFVELGGYEKRMEELSAEVELLYLEDVKEEIKPQDKALALLGPIFPSVLAANPNPEDAGVILFTSGTEGAPKGVVLSHRNIIANIEQISEHVFLQPTDIFFNPLPTFHCYGLTAGALWPVLNGYPVVFHPSPLQTKIIPKRIFETGSTVLFATDTFLSQYMRASPDGGMSSLRIAVCGAERVRDETRQAAEKRFGFEVLEGYGVTEASPVLAANQPGDIRSGTVGKLLPAVEAKLEAVEGLEGAGRLFVRGPNVMKGYLSSENPGVIVPLEDGWHDTGDIVAIDPNGYVSIRGRLKRFAKIGGEMVSLAVVENCASAVWPDNLHAAAIMPDPKKGEQ